MYDEALYPEKAYLPPRHSSRRKDKGEGDGSIGQGTERNMSHLVSSRSPFAIEMCSLPVAACSCRLSRPGGTVCGFPVQVASPRQFAEVWDVAWMHQRAEIGRGREVDESGHRVGQAEEAGKVASKVLSFSGFLDFLGRWVDDFALKQLPRHSWNDWNNPSLRRAAKPEKMLGGADSWLAARNGSTAWTGIGHRQPHIISSKPTRTWKLYEHVMQGGGRRGPIMRPSNGQNRHPRKQQQQACWFPTPSLEPNPVARSWSGVLMYACCRPQRRCWRRLALRFAPAYQDRAKRGLQTATQQAPGLGVRSSSASSPRHGGFCVLRTDSSHAVSKRNCFSHKYIWSTSLSFAIF